MNQRSNGTSGMSDGALAELLLNMRCQLPLADVYGLITARQNLRDIDVEDDEAVASVRDTVLVQSGGTVRAPRGYVDEAAE